MYCIAVTHSENEGYSQIETKTCFLFKVNFWKMAKNNCIFFGHRHFQLIVGNIVYKTPYIKLMTIFW